MNTRTMASSAMGTLTKKTEPHQNFSNRSPEARMPRAPPAPAKPDQMAMALARSCEGNTTVMMESVAGIVRAAPTPITPRRGDELARIVAECGNQSRGHEDAQAQKQRGLATVSVSKRAGRQEEPGEDQRVGGVDPHQF